MIVENRGQQQSIRYVIDTNMLIRNIRMNVYCVISVRWIV